MPEEQAQAIIQSEHNGHYLSFHEKAHRYTFDGRHAPGGSTFTKDGYPTSEGLIIWRVTRAAEAAVRLAWEEAREQAVVALDDRPHAYIPPFTNTRIAELVKEAKKKPEQVADAAADVGILVHDYAYKTELGDLEGARRLLEANGGHPDIEKVRRCLSKFDAWYLKTRDVIVASEAIVALPCPIHYSEADKADISLQNWAFDNSNKYTCSSLCLCYAGKFDRLVMRGNKLILSDFKTASGIRIDQFLQLAAYKKAIEYWLNRKIDGLEILRFGKEKGEFEELLIEDPQEIQALEERMMACRETYAFSRYYAKDRRFAYTPTKKDK